VKTFTKGKEKIHAINGITLDIEQQSFTVVMGPSGSGKSTLLNLIAGLDRPTSGEILLKGINMTKLTYDELCDIRRHEIGIIFQFFYMHEGLTALQNIEYPMLIVGRKKEERKARAKNLLKYVDLGNKSDFLPNQLSGGELQRLGIARALANDPDVIIADEPTGNLDSSLTKNIITLFSQLMKDLHKTIIMVTHDESLLTEDMSIVHLVDGKISPT
ncbi:MAG: ABC transporter ATP-binding protein, partial [Candidatus Hodarchaeota archaeon]